MKIRTIYAATGTPIVKTRDGIKIVMAQRVQSSSFFPGFHVFPGGAVDPKDIEMARLMGGTNDLVEGEIPEKAYRIAVIREYFEEMGVLLTDKGALRTQSLQLLRQKLLRDEIDFPAVLDKTGVEFWQLPIDKMIYAGTQTTPPYSPRIYVARYYFFPWKNQHELFPHSREYLGARWISPQNILQEFNQLKARIPPPVLHVLRTLATTQYASAAQILAEKGDMPHGIVFPIEFAPNYEVIPFISSTIPPAIATNLVCIGAEEYYVIDPGAGNPKSQQHLVNVLLHKKSRGKRLAGIILTHHHKDHFEAVPAILEHFEVPVLAHKHTIQRISQQIDLPLEDIPEKIPLPSGNDNPESELVIIHTPGHTRGSITIYHPYTGIAAVGDLMAGIGTVVINPPEGDLLQYLESLKLLLELKLRMIIPGHGPPLFSPHKALQDYITHRMERHKAIEQALERGAGQIMDIVKHVYKDDIPPKLYPLAARSVLAHLYALVEERKLSQEQLEQLIVGYDLKKFPPLESLK